MLLQMSVSHKRHGFTVILTVIWLDAWRSSCGELLTETVCLFTGWWRVRLMMMMMVLIWKAWTNSCLPYRWEIYSNTSLLSLLFCIALSRLCDWFCLFELCVWWRAPPGGEDVYIGFILDDVTLPSSGEEMIWQCAERFDGSRSTCHFLLYLLYFDKSSFSDLIR